MQPIQQDNNAPDDLRQSLDAYYNKLLGFDQLRTQWILTLANNPAMCSDAVRLLYQQPRSARLTEAHTLSLKRIVEAAVDSGTEDWTVNVEDEVKAPSRQKLPPAVTLAPGHVLQHRFVLEEKLGSGGVGIVFSALDRVLQSAEAGAARIAVKVLREEFRTDPELLAALQREVGHAQGLSHPNIVRVFDIHEDAGTYFLTMELLKGQLLKRLLDGFDRAPVSRERAMRIITGMCRGLAFAHQKGVVHADFKPGNVILTESDEPKILDFGLAQLAAPLGKAPVVSTAPRVLTPAYASCNRLEGGPPGFSDDVYSLCCVIYELLSGRHPYGRKSALAAWAMDLRPMRIKQLSDLQWRTLSSGLMLSRERGTTQVHDLQVAFSPLVALRPAAAGKGKSLASGDATAAKGRKAGDKSAKVRKDSVEPVARPMKHDDRRRRRALKNVAPIISSLLLGAIIVAGLMYLAHDPRQPRTNPIDQLQDSDWYKTLLVKIGLADPEPEAKDAATRKKQRPAGKKSTAAPQPKAAKARTAEREGQGAAGKTKTAPQRSAPTPQPTKKLEQPAPGVQDKAEAAAVSPMTRVEPQASAAKPVAAKTPVVETRQPVEASAAEPGPVQKPAAVTAGFRFDSSAYVIDEGSAALALRITRQGDLSSPARVEWTTYEDTAESRVDYVGAFRNVELFAAGESTKTVYVPIVSDDITERDESFRVALSRPAGNMILIDPFTATVTIVDDDF